MRPLLLILCAAPLLAQTPVREPAAKMVLRLEQPLIDLVQQWLHDPAPQRRAWAADLARRISDASIDAELITALGDLNDIESVQGQLSRPIDDLNVMRLAVLDALIQRASRVPDAVGLAIRKRYPAQAMILLYGRGCPQAETSVQLLRTAVADEVWLAAAECLGRTPGGPVELLRRGQVRAEIDVFDNERRVAAGGTPGGRLGRIVGGLPGDWPHVATYRLASDAEGEPGYVLLTAGPHRVYYVRELHGFNWQESDCEWHHADRNQYALDILAAHIATPFGHRLEPVRSVRLHWITGDQGRADLKAIAADLQQRYALLLSGLAAQNLLTSLERTQCPQSVEIAIRDSRIDKTLPLPSLDSGAHPR